MFCSNCGNNCQENANFCNKCGKELTTLTENQTDSLNITLKGNAFEPIKKYPKPFFSSPMGCFALIVFFIVFIALLPGMFSNTETKVNSSQSKLNIKIPKYEIKYEDVGANCRFDGAVCYYVLINPVNLTNNSFKNDVKTIIKKIVNRKEFPDPWVGSSEAVRSRAS